jgi:hypothetical protein
MKRFRWLSPLVLRLFSVVALFVLTPGVGQAAQVELDANPDAPRFQVYLWTMDQGDQVYELFGHNALVIEDAWTGQALAWNWGLFNFEDADFLSRFLRGTMRYSMGPADPAWFLASYIEANRTVIQNRIHLTEAEAEALDALVRWNFEPENRPYIYDYFRDNCSTRVRDALDAVLGGVIREHFDLRPFPWTYRDQARHLVQRVSWVDQGLSFLLGSRGDAPRSEFEAMYVPMTLLELLEAFEVETQDGARRPLLGPREVLYASTRSPLPPTPPSFTWSFLILGMVGGGTLLLLRRRETAVAPEPVRLRILIGGIGTGWALVAGLLGALLVFSLGTDHVFMHRNLNLFQTNPLHLVAAVLLLRRMFSGIVPRGLASVTLVIAALSAVGLVFQGVGILSQGNADVLALAVPLNLGLWLNARGLTALKGPLPPFFRPRGALSKTG